MKTLLILRHAKSSWKDADLSDHDRPLNKRGRSDAPRMAQLLVEKGLEPDHVVCSSARRAQQTARQAIKGGPWHCEVTTDDRLYMAAAQDVIEVLRQVPEENARVMVIGHNPGLEELAEALTGEPAELPTAAIAQVELDIETWSDLDLSGLGTMAAVWKPREVLRSGE